LLTTGIENIATNKQAYLDYHRPMTLKTIADRVLDGNLESCMVTNMYVDHELVIDLGDNYYIDNIRIFLNSNDTMKNSELPLLCD